ncbi:Uncharacterised protein [Mycobacteroides abscessus subsp. abscessus]|nr:Uncharacterised protein [Mycobacteroides abscessus subsp. abscessus]
MKLLYKMILLSLLIQTDAITVMKPKFQEQKIPFWMKDTLLLIL